MTRITSQGTVVVWAGVELEATSVTYSASAGDEIDITSLASSVRTDPSNSLRKFVTREYDSCFAGEAAELSVEFFAAAGANLADLVGHKRGLSVSMPNSETGASVTTITNQPSSPANAFAWSRDAILANLQITATTGEYVRGTTTFRMTG